MGLRLKPEKIRALARVIYDGIAKEEDLRVDPDREKVEAQIYEVILRDMQAEEEIEREAEQMLEEHEDEIKRSDAQYHLLLQKTKERLARQRRMVL